MTASILPEDPLVIRILSNNIPSDPRLQTDWGFAALVEYRDAVVLFDTGGNGRILLRNMNLLGIDPARAQCVILSHAHADHTGGLAAFLDATARPPVYLLNAFGPAFVQSVRDRTEAVEAEPGMEISPGILTTGNVGGSIPEQALVIRTGSGLVILTGCAHSGIVQIVESAVRLTGDPVRLVLGGFQLREKSAGEISAILGEFRRLGVQKVAPSHCTGELAMRLFAAVYEESYLKTGVGSRIRID